MVLSILKLIQMFQVKKVRSQQAVFAHKRGAKAGRIVSLTGYRRKLYVGFCLKDITSIDDINFTDLSELFDSEKRKYHKRR